MTLPHRNRSEEVDFKVEIIVGKEMLTDGVNLISLGYSIEPRSLKGWGYTYYEVTGSGNTMSTLMAPPEGTTRVKEFVTAPSLLVPYNSRHPIVIYAPHGIEVRYRIWNASDVSAKAERK